MAATTGIEWAHSTVNIFVGCTKISPACKHCYAETNSPVRVMQKRVGLKMWGAGGFRYETANWERELRALNRKAKRVRVARADNDAPVRPRIFINSLSDTFEDWQGPVYRLEDGKPVVVAQSLDDVRARFFRVAEECSELDILLLTKRPENILRMVPNWWHYSALNAALRGQPWPSWIWVGTTVEAQAHADKRIPELLKVPAKVRFLSVEPLLGKVDLSAYLWAYSGGENGPWYDGFAPTLTSPRWGGPSERHIPGATGREWRRARTDISWVIVGGESGTNARTLDISWARSVVDQCRSAGVPVFVKQLGDRVSATDGRDFEWLPESQASGLSKKGGNVEEFPADLRVREVPR